MKTGLFALALLIGFGFPALAAPPVDEPPPKAVALLNGRDLTGWYLFLGDVKPASDAFTPTADGAVRSAAKRKGDFVTEKSFSNRRPHLEWRWPVDTPAATNGGVFLHVRKPDALRPVCIEAHLADRNAGQPVGQRGLEVPGAPLINGKKRAPKLDESSEKPIGEWNTETSSAVATRATSPSTA